MLVKFGNNWIQKIPRTAKLAVLGIFLIQLFPNWTACSPITYTKRRNDAKIWVDFMKTNHSLIMRTALAGCLQHFKPGPSCSKSELLFLIQRI